MASRKARARAIATAVVIACLTPALWLGWLAYADELGANPIEEITHVTGEWTLRMLVLTLGVTPARKLFGWSWLAPQRRTLGLFSFFYATLHLLTYAVLDLGYSLCVVSDIDVSPAEVLRSPRLWRGWQAADGRR